MNQLAFSLCRANDPLSSELAAESITRVLGELQAHVLNAVVLWPGLTAIELAHEMSALQKKAWCFGYHRGDSYFTANSDWQSFHDWTRRRLPELVRRNLVQRGPMRKCLFTGRSAQTWNPKEGA